MLIERMRKRLAADRASFIEPCLPSPADKLPSGSNWIHEIKHDGFRLMARRDPVGIRLITRKGNDWTNRYPLVVEAVNHLKVRSCLIDGEVVCCDEQGVTSFQLPAPQAERAASIPLRLRPAGAERSGFAAGAH
jgi:ATP-dependent DNA ligase